MTPRRVGRIEKNLIRDRVVFLEQHAIEKKAFKTAALAKQFAQEQLRANGLRYTVAPRGKTVKLADVAQDDVRKSSEFTRIKKDLSTRSKSPHGKKARALEALGRRENFFDWPVGETPS